MKAIAWVFTFLLGLTLMLTTGCVYKTEREVVKEPPAVPKTTVTVREEPPYIPSALRVDEAGPAPSATHVWIPGHWDWDGNEWVWTSGSWQLPPSYNATWVSGHWEWNGRSWVWVPGYWR